MNEESSQSSEKFEYVRNLFRKLSIGSINSVLIEEIPISKEILFLKKIILDLSYLLKNSGDRQSIITISLLLNWLQSIILKRTISKNLQHITIFENPRTNYKSLLSPIFYNEFDMMFSTMKESLIFISSDFQFFKTLLLNRTGLKVFTNYVHRIFKKQKCLYLNFFPRFEGDQFLLKSLQHKKPVILDLI